jgi:hypothetical protein
VGLAKVISDLTVKGHVPCLPLSEHQPYDLIVATRDGSTFKVQVKYSRLQANGTIEVRYRRSWSDSKHTYSKPYGKSEFDYYALYCPEKDTVLYVPNGGRCPKSIRFDRPANNQARSVKWAESYLDLTRESSETIRRTPETVKT